MAGLVELQFHEKNVPVTLISRSPFLQSILEVNAKTSRSCFHNMSIYTKFELVVFSHFLSIFHAELKDKAMIVKEKKSTGA